MDPRRQGDIMESLTPVLDSSSAANEQVTLFLWASFHLRKMGIAVLSGGNSKHSINYHHQQKHHLYHQSLGPPD